MIQTLDTKRVGFLITEVLSRHGRKVAATLSSQQDEELGCI